jgi:cephalosporin hydroxylase
MATNPTDPKDIALIEAMGQDAELRALAHRFFLKTCEYRYSYNFSWLGRPAIQYPQDLFAIQELMWRIRPDLVIETGVAHGGSLVFYASILELIHGAGLALGIDVDIRSRNRTAIEAHPVKHRILLLEGSSVDERVVSKTYEMARDKNRVIVVLDSNHTHAHVLRELELYSPLVKRDGYIVVLDTVVEQMPKDAFPNRPWGPGNSPATAVKEFLAGNRRFVVDEEIDNKLLISTAPGGYLRCVND